MDTTLDVSKERKKEFISQIKSYFENEREEKIGDIAAGQILNYFIKMLAKEFYNKGVSDAYNYLSELLPDLLELQK